MYPRTNYEMSAEDLKELMEACKPVPCMLIGGTTGPSQQDNANAAWARLGRKMGFDPMTVQPTGRGNTYFSAVPSETPEQKEQREADEAEAKRQLEIANLQDQIEAKQKRLKELTAKPAEDPQNNP